MEFPILEGVEYDIKMDIEHTSTIIEPPDYYNTFYYNILYMYIIRGLSKKQIVCELNDMYPWYRNKNLAITSKACQLTRLLKNIKGKCNPRLTKVIIKYSDDEILEALNELNIVQKSVRTKLRQGDWGDVLTKPINKDTFKRRLGRICYNKYLQDKYSTLKLVESVININGPWNIQEWEWYHHLN